MIYFLVLALEPSNTTAQEFLPVIDERIKLGDIHVTSKAMVVYLFINR